LKRKSILNTTRLRQRSTVPGNSRRVTQVEAAVKKTNAHRNIRYEFKI